MKPIACAALAALALVGCNPQPAQQAKNAPAPSATPTGLPPLKITGSGKNGQPVKIVQQSGNRKQDVLEAHSYVSHSAQNVAQASFQEATVTFYGKDGTTLTAQAPTARLDDKTHRVLLEGGVHAKTSTGLTMTCDTLEFDRSTSLLHGQGHVRVTGRQGGAEQVLTGNSFTSDVKLTQMVMR
jgi:LPS export ABC transporter protein LptC